MSYTISPNRVIDTSFEYGSPSPVPMAENSWEEVLDELYEMGGYGETTILLEEGNVNEDLDLDERTGLAEYELVEIVDRLASAELVHMTEKSPIGNQTHRELNSNLHQGIGLTEEGFSLAHDRQAEERNHKSNRSITILTFVLAVVGFAQATALTARANSKLAGGVLLGAGIILLVVYYGLVRAGAIDFEALY